MEARQTEEHYSLDPEGVLRAAEGLFPGAAEARAVGCYGCVVLVLLPVPKRRGRGMTLRQRAAYWRGGFEELRRRYPETARSEWRYRLFILVASGPEEADALAAAFALAPRPKNVDWATGRDPGWEAVRPLLEQPHRAGRLLSATARF